MITSQKQQALEQMECSERQLSNGKLDAALSAYKAIYEVDFNDFKSGMRYAQLALSLNEYSQAIRAYSKLAEIHVNHQLVLAGLGRAYLNNRQYMSAIKTLKEATQLAPELADAHADLGAALLKQNDLPAAMQALDRAMELKPSSPHACINKAECLRKLGEHEKALAFANKAISLAPRSPHALFTLARIHLDMGASEKAFVNIDKAISINPTFGPAYHIRASIRKATEADQVFIDKAEHQLKESLLPEHRASIQFGLGKIYDDLKLYDKAFAQFAAGNLMLTSSSPAIPPYELFKMMRKTFHSKTFEQAYPQSCDSKIPVFVVGMPRSGSTLIEQIISSHPSATGIGETRSIPEIAEAIASTNDLNSFKQNWLAALTSEQLSHSATNYLQRLQRANNDSLRVVDKMLGNYFQLGIIQCMFPQATIIHAVRDPIDTCLSCYFQLLMDAPWSFDLQSIGRWYCFYREVMAYWQSALPPNRIVHVEYEALVKNQESESRRLIAACGLDWDPRCLDFHRLQKTVATASQAQVRQPIYQASLKRWEPYARHLGELASILSPYLSESDMATLEKNGVKVSRRLRWLKKWI